MTKNLESFEDVADLLVAQQDEILRLRAELGLLQKFAEELDFTWSSEKGLQFRSGYQKGILQGEIETRKRIAKELFSVLKEPPSAATQEVASQPRTPSFGLAAHRPQKRTLSGEDGEKKETVRE